VVASVSSVLPWFTSSGGYAPTSLNAFQFGNNGSFSIDGVFLTALGIVGVAVGVTNLRNALPRFLTLTPMWLGVGVAIEAALFELPPIDSGI
jgi:hypothetical protein